MVLPVHETRSSVWEEWRGWLRWLASASAVFAGVWWLVSCDAKGALIAAAVPWGIALGGLLITVVWGIVLVPLMVVLAGISTKRITLIRVAIVGLVSCSLYLLLGALTGVVLHSGGSNSYLLPGVVFTHHYGRGISIDGVSPVVLLGFLVLSCFIALFLLWLVGGKGRVTKLIRIILPFWLASGLLTVVAIMGVGAHHPPCITITRTSIQAICVALRQYAGDVGTYPPPGSSLAVLTTNSCAKGSLRPYFKDGRLPKDAWGNDFSYSLKNGAPVVTSAGPDGKFDTADDLSN